MYMARRFRRGRGGCHTRPSIVPPSRLLCRFFSSQKDNAPLNLFEIDLKPLEASVPSMEKLTLDDAKRALALQQTDAQHEIDVLHDGNGSPMNWVTDIWRRRANYECVHCNYRDAGAFRRRGGGVRVREIGAKYG